MNVGTPIWLALLIFNFFFLFYGYPFVIIIHSETKLIIFCVVTSYFRCCYYAETKIYGNLDSSRFVFKK